MKSFPLAVIAAFSALAACATPKTTSEPSADNPTSFAKHIKPIFERRCVRCHNGYQMPAGLDLTKRDAVLAGKRTVTGQPFIVAGHPESSLIYHAVTQPAEHPNMMPGDGWGLSTPQEQHVYNWIQSGAAWPNGFRGRLREKSLRVEFDGDL